MSSLRSLMSGSALIGAVMVGYGMWSLIAPGEERRRELIKNLPESNPMRMEETRKRNMMVLQAIKDAAETDENIARTLGQRGK
ncbi:ubiquinol-cytochrome-c reductase complex assembly factor 3 [Nelusetta ayraudi]|uniref:ubiquinol-cytochrome-c reductase complex assembly factor 3 n=1 Tax=Nelusetta ayraudi TaxID=303726 RepID=UPI003F6E986B